MSLGIRYKVVFEESFCSDCYEGQQFGDGLVGNAPSDKDAFEAYLTDRGIVEWDTSVIMRDVYPEYLPRQGERCFNCDQPIGAEGT